MRAAAYLEEIERNLAADGIEDVEVFLKEGRSRRFELGPQGRISTVSREQGWAVRAGTGRASFFAAGTGRPDPKGPWPEADGEPLRLPRAMAVPRWSAVPEMDAALLVETEAIGILEAIERELDRELRGARLLRAVLDEGTSRSAVASSLGIDQSVRSRAAFLELMAETSTGGPATARCSVAVRQARQLNPRSLARRLADLLSLAGGRELATADRADVLLAPTVAAHVITGLTPLLVGPEAAARAAALRDRQGRIGSRGLSVIDDGRLPGGVLEAPVDGEGVATGEVVLVEGGRFQQPLLAWWQTDTSGPRSTGCSRRAGWRDVPEPGPTHLYVRPDPTVGVGALVESMVRGYYLLDVWGAGRFDLAADRLAIPVRGFALRRGEAAEPVTRAWLCGSISTFLHGVQAVARDLAFQPVSGMVGSPTLLVSGLELR